MERNAPSRQGLKKRKKFSFVSSAPDLSIFYSKKGVKYEIERGRFPMDSFDSISVEDTETEELFTEPSEKAVEELLEESPDEDKFPDTRRWSEEQKVEFLNKNFNWIQRISRKYTNIQDKSLTNDDLAQEAALAFMDTLETYDPSKGVPFHRYSYVCMDNAIKEMLRRSCAVKRKPKQGSIPYDSDVSANGETIMGADNMPVKSSIAEQNMSIEEILLKNEFLKLLDNVFEEKFLPVEKYIFFNLALKQKTQKELAAELGCSQPKISLLYQHIHLELYNELKKRKVNLETLGF